MFYFYWSKGWTNPSQNQRWQNQGHLAVIRQHQIRHVWDWRVPPLSSRVRLGTLVPLSKPSQILVDAEESNCTNQVTTQDVTSISSMVLPKTQRTFFDKHRIPQLTNRFTVKKKKSHGVTHCFIVSAVNYSCKCVLFVAFATISVVI